MKTSFLKGCKSLSGCTGHMLLSKQGHIPIPAYSSFAPSVDFPAYVFTHLSLPCRPIMQKDYIFPFDINSSFLQAEGNSRLPQSSMCSRWSKGYACSYLQRI